MAQWYTCHMKTQTQKTDKTTGDISHRLPAIVEDKRPATQAYAKLQAMAATSPNTLQLKRLQAKADQAGARKEKARSAKNTSSTVQLQDGGASSNLTVGIALLLAVLAFVFFFLFPALGRRQRNIISNRAANDTRLQSAVSVASHDAPDASPESLAHAVTQNVGEQVVEEAAVLNSPVSADHLNATASATAPPEEVATPSASTPENHSPGAEVPGNAGLDITAVGASKLDISPAASSSPRPLAESSSAAAKPGDAEADNTGAAVPQVAITSGKKTPKDKEIKKPKSNKTREGRHSSASSSAPAFSDEDIETYKSIEADLDDYDEIALRSMGLDPVKQAAIAEALRISRRKEAQDNPEIAEQRRAQAQADADNLVDAELAAAFDAKTNSGEHYVNWIIDGKTCHVTVRGGDTRHVTIETIPEEHYYFDIGDNEVIPVHPTNRERGQPPTIYAPLDRAPEKVRKFVERYYLTGTLMR